MLLLSYLFDKLVTSLWKVGFTLNAARTNRQDYGQMSWTTDDVAGCPSGSNVGAGGAKTHPPSPACNSDPCGFGPRVGLPSAGVPSLRYISSHHDVEADLCYICPPMPASRFPTNHPKV